MKIKLFPQVVAKWPKLAWLAHIIAGEPNIHVFHGPFVEANEMICVEAVWAGDFEDGDFDRTNLIYGSGIRCREETVVFVTSGIPLERLWYVKKGKSILLANSLPCILAASKMSLIDGFNYSNHITTVWGETNCTKSIPVMPGELSFFWCNNIVYDGNDLIEVKKELVSPQIDHYHDYYEFLKRTATALGTNLSSNKRKHKVSPVTSLSSGYDSAAVAVISKYAGCKQAVTIENATSLFPRDDSGLFIAQKLDLECKVYNQKTRNYPNEIAVWAASGHASLLNWTLFELTEPLSLFFSGCYGDNLWKRSREMHDVAPDMYFPISLDLGMDEYRLFKGMFHCAMPFWNMQQLETMSKISYSKEMEPWTLNNDYDRPIPRRILEEAGIPRDAFGVRKENTSHEEPFQWTYSPEARRSFASFLKKRKIFSPSNFWLKTIMLFLRFEYLFSANVLTRFGLKFSLRSHFQLKGSSMLFEWGNYELKKVYEKGLTHEGIEIEGI